MKNIIYFDFSIKTKVVEDESTNNNVEKLSLDELKGIMNGNLFIIFEPQREYIILRTGIFDYLKQIQGVIEEIEQGNLTPFSVSCDWYSNNLSYKYEKSNDQLRIIDVNEQRFEIVTSYKLFKKAFDKFYKQAIEDILLLYPALRNNFQFK